MTPIRVLYFATTNLKSGGSIRSLVDFLTILTKKSLVSPIVVLPDHGTAEELLTNAQLKYIVVKSYGSEWPQGEKKTLRRRLSHFRQRLENRRAIKTACDAVKQNHIQLIHINTSICEIGYYVARRTRTPFIWHLREFVPEGIGHDFYRATTVYRHMRKADGIIAISRALQERYRRLLKRNDILLIHNGIDPTIFYQNQNKDFEGPLRVAMVGRVSRLKGHYLAIDALALAPSLNIELQIVGSEDEDLKSYAIEKGVERMVSFVGFQDDVRPYLEKSQLFLSAHSWEAFGRAAVEAMLMGCVVIGVNNAGTKDIIEDGVSGLLFSQNNAYELAGILQYADKHRADLAKMGAEAQKRALAFFTITTCASNIYQMYRSVFRF